MQVWPEVEGGGKVAVHAVFLPNTSRWGDPEACTSQAFQSFAETLRGGMWVKGDALGRGPPWEGPEALDRLGGPPLQSHSTPNV